jgi:hypothetical protein
VTRALSTKLFWTGVVVLLVAVKLLLSFFWPGLRAPGELLVAAFLLLVSTVQIFVLYVGLRKAPPSEGD